MLPAVTLLLDHPFEHATWIGWLAVLAGHFLIIRRDDADEGEQVKWLHSGGLWLLIILVSWEMAWVLDEAINGADTWRLIAWGLVPAGFLAVIRHRADRLPWPLYAHAELYRVSALLPVGFYLWAWVLVMNLDSSGGAAPLPFVPILNPMDIAVGFALFALFDWLRRDNGSADTMGWRFAFTPWALAATIFVWLNAMWFRTAHHWLMVGFNTHSMLHSQTVQAGLALLWGICGLGTMIAGTRLTHRRSWFAGAALMAVVVAKLFLVDLSNSGTMARIVSFITVGILLLVVGYLSPIPPKDKPE